MSTILVTGFEPFGEDRENPSGRVAAALDGRHLGGASLVGRILPVDHERLGPVLDELLADVRPDVVICTGLAVGRPGISLERLALNVADFSQPDNAGRVVVDAPVAIDGPLTYSSTLPITIAVDRLRSAGIPAEISNSAGTFLCNEVMYLALRYAERDGSMRAGFVHLPYHSEYIAARRKLAPSLPLALLVTAVEMIAIAAVESIELETYS